MSEVSICIRHTDNAPTEVSASGDVCELATLILVGMAENPDIRQAVSVALRTLENEGMKVIGAMAQKE